MTYEEVKKFGRKRVLISLESEKEIFGDIYDVKDGNVTITKSSGGEEVVKLKQIKDIKSKVYFTHPDNAFQKNLEAQKKFMQKIDVLKRTEQYELRTRKCFYKKEGGVLKKSSEKANFLERQVFDLIEENVDKERRICPLATFKNTKTKEEFLIIANERGEIITTNYQLKAI